MATTGRNRTLQCPNCGAGADVDTIRCAYCQSVLKTTACPSCFAAVFRGVKFCPSCGEAIARNESKNDRKLLCPRCELLLAAADIGETRLHECQSCGGIWLDMPAFDKLCADREQQEQILLYEVPADPAKPQSEIRKDRLYIPCPDCGELMNQKNYARSSGVVIDICKLHGIWFERDELQRIVNFIRSGGLRKAREDEIARLEAEQSKLRAMKNSQSMVQRSLMSDPYERDFSDGRSLIDVLYAIAKRILR